MEIIRDNKVIELTSAERMRAYQEQQHLFDIQDVRQELDYQVDARPTKRLYIQQLLDDKERISQIAYDKRRRMRDYGMGTNVATEEAIDMAINSVMKYGY